MPGSRGETSSCSRSYPEPPARLPARARVPGDKSISHRALMVGALAVGETEIHGLLEGEDVLRSAAGDAGPGCRRSAHDKDGIWRVVGRGIGGLVEPADVLDLGNAGTGARLLMGVVASHPIAAVFTGDASLRRRPMGRVIEPLRQMGARFAGARGRSPAADGDRHRRCHADPLPPAGPLGPGEIGDPAGRPEHAGRDRGDRARADPRSYRTDAPPFRRRGHEPRRRPRAAPSPWSASPKSPAGASRCRPIPPRPPFRWSRPCCCRDPTSC